MLHLLTQQGILQHDCLLQISQDPRYTALPERRCRQLFNAYHSTLKDLQSAPDTASSDSSQTIASASSSSAPASSSSMQAEPDVALGQGSIRDDEQQLWQQLGPGQVMAELTQRDGAQVPTAEALSGGEGLGPIQSAAQLDALDALRQEQARLKAEYDRMEVRRQSAFTTYAML